jgi:hypothetical protein
MEAGARNKLEAGQFIPARGHVVISSSWTIAEWRSVQVNLVLMGGGGCGSITGPGSSQRLREPPITAPALHNTSEHRHFDRNNTLDGRDGTGGMNAIPVTGSETATSNLFMNIPYTPSRSMGR